MLGSLGPNDWSRKHGPGWIYADLSFHQSYFDKDSVAEPIERGKEVPAAEMKVWPTLG